MADRWAVLRTLQELGGRANTREVWSVLDRRRPMRYPRDQVSAALSRLERAGYIQRVTTARPHDPVPLVWEAR